MANASRGGIGGAAGDAGVEYRRAVGAYAVAHGLAGWQLPGFGVERSFADVDAVALETDDAVDDVRIEFRHGAVAYVQAKRTLEKKRESLHAAVAQWATAACGGLEVGRDHLVVATGQASGSMRTLQRALARLKTDTPAAFTKAEQTEIDYVKMLLGGLTEADKEVVLRCASIVVVQVEEPVQPGAEHAMLLLAQIVAEPSTPAQAWAALLARAGATARLRGGFSMRGWLRQLRAEGIGITSSQSIDSGLAPRLEAIERYVAQLSGQASSVDLRPLGARIPPIPLAEIDLELDVSAEGDRAGAELLWVFLRRRRVVLTGLPGAGKSMALVRLAAQVSQIDDWLPIRVSLRDVDRRPPDESFRDRLLAVGLRDLPEQDRPHLAEEISRGLDTGATVVLLDGLDETYDRRGPVVADVDRFLATCSSEVAVVLSTRDVAYGHAQTLRWHEVRLQAPSSCDKLVAAVLKASREAAVARGEHVDVDWVGVRSRWVDEALAKNATLRETPLIPTLLALLAGERAPGRLPTARPNILRAAVEGMVERRRLGADGLQIGALKDTEAATAALDAFASIGRTLIDHDGQCEKSELITVLASEIAAAWGVPSRKATATAKAAVHFWDEHGIFVINGAEEFVAPRLQLFADIGDAMAAVSGTNLEVWITDRVKVGATESLVLASGLSKAAAGVFIIEALRSQDRDLLHGAVNAHGDGVDFDADSLEGLRDALLADVSVGGREGWHSLAMFLSLPFGGDYGEAVDDALRDYETDRRAIGRAATRLLAHYNGDASPELATLREVVTMDRPDPLKSRDGTKASGLDALGWDRLFDDTVEKSAELLLESGGGVQVVLGVLDSIGLKSRTRLMEVMEQKGLEEQVAQVLAEDRSKSARFYEHYRDLGRHEDFLEEVVAIARPTRLTLAQRISLDHLADFVETLNLNDTSTWRHPFSERTPDVVRLVATLGGFDLGVLAAQADIVRERASRFDSHSAFFCLFNGASSVTLDRWEDVEDIEAGVDLCMGMFKWGVGCAWVAARMLWRANEPFAARVKTELSVLVPELAPSARHQEIAGLTLCSINDSAADGWVADSSPVLRSVATAAIDATDGDGNLTDAFRRLLDDEDRNVRASATGRLKELAAPLRDQLLKGIAAAPEPGWTCQSCQTANSASLSSCLKCSIVPDSPAERASKLLAELETPA